MIKAVIFDVDGTLIDTVDLHAKAWVEALRHFEVEVPFHVMRRSCGKLLTSTKVRRNQKRDD